MPDNDPTTPGTFVKALFAIDARTPEDVFEGWHNPAHDWNGFAVPSFDHENAINIIAWVAPHEGPEASPRTSFHWQGEELIMTQTYDDGEQDHQRVGPDPDGRYWIGANSWVWYEVEVPQGHALDTWLQRNMEDGYVLAAATNIANTWAIEAGIGWPARHRPTTNIANDALAQLALLRPTETNAALGDEAIAHLQLSENDRRARTQLTWAGLTVDERNTLLTLAVSRATRPDALIQAFFPQPAT